MEEDASNKKEDGFNKLSLYDLQVRLCLTFAARSDHLQMLTDDRTRIMRDSVLLKKYKLQKRRIWVGNSQMI